MDTKAIAEAVLGRRGPALLVAGLVLFALCAAEKVGSFQFDPLGRGLLGAAALVLLILGILFIIRDRTPAMSGIGQPSDCPIEHREQLPRMSDWLPAGQAKDILMIGINLNLVFRQRAFFAAKLAERTQIRLVIADPRDQVLVNVIKRGVEEKEHTKPDFQASLDTIAALRKALSDRDKSLIDLRVIDYVPTLSFQVLDGGERHGTILVELAPNKVSVPERPHFILQAANPAHHDWYDRFLHACNRIYADAKKWSWG